MGNDHSAPLRPRDGADEAAERDHGLWERDHLQLTTVGIDIGSATFQVLFSTIELRRQGRELSSRYAVVSRQVRYRSPLRLTPYVDGQRIDEAAVEETLRRDFAAAGLSPDEVDSGAVILTGEALRRRNARALADALARAGGPFVCVTAGHHMEAHLAAHGAGAVARSRSAGERVLNIDIGGGTTKFALVEAGAVRRTAALHAGGRLVAFDEDDRIVRLEPMGAEFAAQCGLAWRLGDRVDRADVRRLGRFLAETVAHAAGWPAGPGDWPQPWLTEPLGSVGPVDAVVLSGGVAEFVHDPAATYDGDLGRAFGSALGELSNAWPAPIARERSEGMEATVLGASQYSVQVSGNTIHVSGADVLPMRNVPVLHPHVVLEETVDAEAVRIAIGKAFGEADLVEGEDDAALALTWTGPPSFARISALAEGLALGLRGTLERGHRLCVVVDGDVARLLGAMLAERAGPGAPVVVVDGIALERFDHIDIGRVMQPSGVLPISIKSLVFSL